MARGLSNRWVRGNLLVTILILLVAETLLMLYTVNASYASARQTLRGEIALLSGRYLSVQDSSVRERAALLRTMVQETAADEFSVYTMQLLDEDGGLYATSEGFLPQQRPDTAEGDRKDGSENYVFEPQPEDFRLAGSAQDDIGETVEGGRSGAPVMAVTWLVPSPVQGIRAVRLVTSLSGINRQIWRVFAISFTVVVACFGLILLTGMYFIRSIVRPLAQVETTATRIAQGNFTIRLQKRHNDEIGRLCETINHMAEELSKTEKLKNEFISSVSHELRTPLTSIKGWTETLQRIDDVEDPNYAHGMRIITRETDRLYGMVEELLDFSRMQSKGLELSLARLDLAAEVGDAVLMVQQRAAQAGVSVRFEEGEELLMVNGDADRLRQVFINILDNAVKYSPAGTEIAVVVGGQDEVCSVAVSDQGPGIAPDELELVKTRFYKGRGSVHGSGIGLAVADEIVQAHGGSLQLQSVPGQGTTVLIRLPLQKE